jgi:hypothetical protein
MVILPFEDDDLTLIPMAGRRALDRAGLRLSLRAWQGLSLPVRSMIVSLGSEEDVRADDVRRLIASAHPAPEPIEPPGEPPADHVPAEVAASLELDAAWWSSIGPVARFALFSYARRGKTEKLRSAHAALLAAPSRE